MAQDQEKSRKNLETKGEAFWALKQAMTMASAK